MNCHYTTLRLRPGNGFFRALLHLAATVLLALFVPVLASGYTIVMLGGHRVEIPDEFQLTETTLTYTASPGILVTLQLSSIDVMATDIANGSHPGTLLARTNQFSEPRKTPARSIVTSRAARTLTNLDLEPSRVRRLESEAAYDMRRKELGLPSREETDRIIKQESERAWETLARSEIERAEAERYWRTRATQLRNEISVVDWEIDYLRTRLFEFPESVSILSFAGVGGTLPFASPVRSMQGTLPSGPGVVMRGQTSAQSVGTVGVPRAQFGMGPRRFNSCLYLPCAPTYFQPYWYNNGSLDRSSIYFRLNELDATRVGLQARWQILEDEARRAGAQPGWLRQ